MPGWSVDAWWVSALLVAAVCAAFLPILGNEFVGWDDDKNFLENFDYRGLGWPQIAWAWTTFRLGVYQPLSWILLEAQYAACGLDPRGYHLTSLALYAADTVVLYALTLALLARCRPGRHREDPRGVAIAAGLAVAAFAAHPLRAEVVAWASCQPYLPCALFAMLSVLAYLQAHGDGEGEGSPPRAGWLIGSFLLLAAALLCKAVAVSVPAVLVILDVYPLRRLGGGPGRWSGPQARRVWREKLPFLALALPFAILAIQAKAADKVLVQFEHYGLVPRIAQSCYGATFYLAKTVAPFGLTAYYPIPRRPEPWELPYSLCILAVAVMTAVAILLRRRWPGLLAAWAAYLVILAPNLGLARIGGQIAADRYGYLASMGWVVLAAEGLHRLGGPGRWRRAVVVAAGSGVILALIPLARAQARTWANTEALWRHVLAHETVPNRVAHNNLGTTLYLQGQLDEAETQYVEALRIEPQDVEAHYNIGTLLTARGKLDEAEAELSGVLRAWPDHANAHYNLGYILYRRGQFDEAAARFAEALRIDPNHALARHALERADQKRRAARP